VLFIKPEALTSTDLWQEDVNKKDFLAGIEKFAALNKREKNELTSPICALLGAKKISKMTDVTRRYSLMQKTGINIRDNMKIQSLIRELVSLNDEVESVSFLEFAAYNEGCTTAAS
jgi:hypothetical protein